MKLLTVVFILLLIVLQYQLWFRPGGVPDLWHLKREIAAAKAQNAKLKERNQILQAEVTDLKSGTQAIEERARRELGMVKKGERFYQVYHQKKP